MGTKLPFTKFSYMKLPAFTLKLYREKHLHLMGKNAREGGNEVEKFHFRNLSN